MAVRLNGLALRTPPRKPDFVRPLCGILAALTMACGATAALAAANVKVGVTTSVIPAATGTPPNAATKIMQVGDQLVHRERIDTTAKGKVQVLFVDGSAVSVGPNSNVVLDEFLYDPAQKTGKLVISLSKGVLRLVGGRISKNSPIMIKTPSASIGIRGGIATVAVRKNTVKATLLFGKSLTIKSINKAGVESGPQRRLTTPGFSITIDENGNIGEPVRVSAEEINGTYGNFAAADEEESETEDEQESTGSSDTASDGEADTTASEESASQESAENGTDDAAAGEDGDTNTSEDTDDGTITSSDTTTEDDGQTDAAAIDEMASSELNDTGSALEPESITVVSSTDSTGGTFDSVLAVSVQTTETLAGMSQDTTASQSAPDIFQGKVYSGRYYSAPVYDFSTFDWNATLLRADPLPGRKSTFSGLKISNGQLSFALNGTSFTLPAQSGRFNFGSAGTASPFGPVSGTAFMTPDFFFYTLNEVNYAKNRAILWGGSPLADADFPRSGFAKHAINIEMAGTTWNFNDDFLGFLGVANQYSRYAPAIGPDFTDERSVTFSAYLAIVGQGANQKSIFYGAPSNYYRSAPTASDGYIGAPTFGTFPRGSAMLPRDSAFPIRFAFSQSPMPDEHGNFLFGSGTFENFAFDGGYISNGVNPFYDNDDGLGYIDFLDRAIVEPGAGTPLLVAGYGTRVPSGGIGASRTSRTLQGYAGGIVSVLPGSAEGFGASYTYLFQSQDGAVGELGFWVHTNAATNRARGVIMTVNPYDGARINEIIVGVAPSGSTGGRAAFVDDNLFALRDPSRWIFPDKSAGPAPGQSIEGRIGHDPIARADYFVTTSHAVDARALLPPGVSFCACEYLQWGWWYADFRADGNATNAWARELIHLATWVAGDIVDRSALPASGIATYNGHVIGNVVNNGAQYVAAGNFSHTWNFSSKSGSVSINNLDGRNYTGSTFVSGAANKKIHYDGSLSGSGTGALRGSFFKGGGDVAAETGGRFHVKSTNYKAAGTFAAKKQ